MHLYYIFKKCYNNFLSNPSNNSLITFVSSGAHMIHLLFIITLLITAVIDAVTRKIHNFFPLLIAALALCQLVDSPANITSHVIGLFMPALPMLLLAARIGGLGGGDIKLTAACGLFLGTDNVLTGCLLSALLALTVNGILHPVRNEKHTVQNQCRKSGTQKFVFAFGPYLSAGFIVASFL